MLKIHFSLLNTLISYKECQEINHSMGRIMKRISLVIYLLEILVDNVAYMGRMSTSNR